MTKSKLRLEVKEWFAHLSSLEKSKLERELRGRLRAFLNSLLPLLSEHKTIGVFYPFEDEPFWPGPEMEELEKYFAFPDFGQEGMKFFVCTTNKLQKVERFKKEVLIPVGKKKADPEIFLVPGLAFDRMGKRLGRGKGYYDRYFDHHRKVLKIGICFSGQLFENVPCEPHDVQMDVIVTEKEVLDLRKNPQ